MLQGSGDGEKTKAGNDGEAKTRKEEVYVAVERPNIYAERNRRYLVSEEW